MCTYFCTVRARASMHKEGSVSLVTLSSVFAAPRPAGGGGAGSEERDPPRHKGNILIGLILLRKSETKVALSR